MAINRKHIDKVFDQKFSLFDQKKIVNYFEDRQQNEEAKLVIEEQWNNFEPNTERRPDLDHIFYKLYYTIDNQKDFIQKGRSLFLRVSQIAAILVVGILIAASIYFSNNVGKNTSDQSIEFVSQTGFRNHFRLPDGTSGWLGYGSQLQYHIDSNNQRIIDLDGLAYFDVAHRKKQRFIVKMPTNLCIEVLGTRFNVSSYSSDQTSEVVLEQGSVRLTRQDQNVGEMIPNERIVYHSTNKKLEKSTVNVSDYLAWKDGKLFLRDISLDEACIKLSRYYNVDFELNAKNMSTQKVRLLLENESLEDALKLLAMIVPIKYQVEERKVLHDNSYSKKIIIIKNN